MDSLGPQVLPSGLLITRLSAVPSDCHSTPGQASGRQVPDAAGAGCRISDSEIAFQALMRSSAYSEQSVRPPAPLTISRLASCFSIRRPGAHRRAADSMAPMNSAGRAPIDTYFYRLTYKPHSLGADPMSLVINLRSSFSARGAMERDLSRLHGWEVYLPGEECLRVTPLMGL